MSKILRDKVFESDGLAWVVEKSESQPERDWITYSLCPTKKCRVRILFLQDINEVICPNCGRKLYITKDYELLRSEVNAKYQASKLWDAQTINLDLIPTKITSRDEDNNFWIETKLGQKDGKRTAVIYIGEKENSKGEKAQFFVDIDDELVRFDRDDKHPLKVLSRVEVEFVGSVHEITKKGGG